MITKVTVSALLKESAAVNGDGVAIQRNIAETGPLRLLLLLTRLQVNVEMGNKEMELAWARMSAAANMGTAVKEISIASHRLIPTRMKAVWENVVVETLVKVYALIRKIVAVNMV